MSVEIRDDRARGVLEASDGGEVVGHIDYFTLDVPGTESDEVPGGAAETALVPVHTEVASAHEGKGIAGELTAELYAIAAREGAAVAPLCSYVVKWAERHPEQAPAASDALMRAALDEVRTDPSAW
ncbi:GNAT family N-acetyltransferase [Streptomyces sp. 135]|uniref:GNAT family N-acetyltransferase n=1 Tax=Streptomyces sp. 135 TaxID=2838850 RepID=UPI001CC07E42|nr:GNAT family N-acetyltransferase [Streptomyces sp. 135]